MSLLADAADGVLLTVPAEKREQRRLKRIGPNVSIEMMEERVFFHHLEHCRRLERLGQQPGQRRLADTDGPSTATHTPSADPPPGKRSLCRTRGGRYTMRGRVMRRTPSGRPGPAPQAETRRAGGHPAMPRPGQFPAGARARNAGARSPGAG